VRLLESPDIYIDESRVWLLLEDLARREGLHDLGLRIGLRTRLQDLGDFGGTLLRQASLQMALRAFCRLATEEAHGCDFRLHAGDAGLWFIYRGRRSIQAYSDVMELYNVQLMMTVVRAALGPSWLPAAITLRAAALPKGIKASVLSAGPMYLGTGLTGLLIASEPLAVPMPLYGAGDGSELQPESCSLDDPGFGQQIRCLIQGYLGEPFELPDLAAVLGITERTLQRRLEEAGTCYRQLQQEARFDLARKLLANEDARITDISLELGFSSTGNFSRAFHKWAGVSPRQYRRQAIG
jgi:AraC-like DNA-binding protein